MIREKLKALLLSGELILSDIDAVYDDFESRTCANCKYWTKNEECSLLIYTEFVNDFETDRQMATSPNFFCNKWESKDD